MTHAFFVVFSVKKRKQKSFSNCWKNTDLNVNMFGSASSNWFKFYIIYVSRNSFILAQHSKGKRYIKLRTFCLYLSVLYNFSIKNCQFQKQLTRCLLL